MNLNIFQMKRLLCILFLLIFTEISMSGEAISLNQPRAVVPEEAKVSEKFYGMPGLSNVGRIAPGVYRGNQPLKEGYLTLKKMGIKTVINLRTQHRGKSSVESAGMNYMAFPINIVKNLKPEKVQGIIKAMADPNNQPVYIHCALGQDRTGVIVAVYRIEEQGWSPEEAEQEMHDFGFNDMWFNLKKFLKNYSKDKEK